MVLVSRGLIVPSPLHPRYLPPFSLFHSYVKSHILDFSVQPLRAPRPCFGYREGVDGQVGRQRRIVEIHTQVSCHVVRPERRQTVVDKTVLNGDPVVTHSGQRQRPHASIALFSIAGQCCALLPRRARPVDVALGTDARLRCRFRVAHVEVHCVEFGVSYIYLWMVGSE